MNSRPSNQVILSQTDSAQYINLGRKICSELLMEAASNEWVFNETLKNVKLYQKVNKGSAIYSFMGKGIIRRSPFELYSVLSNPLSRYHYDNMVKDIKIISQVDEATTIIYMHHETRQCLVKTARDFSLLLSGVKPEKDDEGKDLGSYIFAGRSIEFPAIPVREGVVRAETLSSGWIIEQYAEPFSPSNTNISGSSPSSPSASPSFSSSPTISSSPISASSPEDLSSPLSSSPLKRMNSRNSVFSKVTYLVRVDLKGSVPSGVINLVSRKQPLCIHYLREHLGDKWC